MTYHSGYTFINHHNFQTKNGDFLKLVRIRSSNRRSYGRILISLFFFLDLHLLVHLFSFKSSFNPDWNGNGLKNCIKAKNKPSIDYVRVSQPGTTTTTD